MSSFSLSDSLCTSVFAQHAAETSLGNGVRFNGGAFLVLVLPKLSAMSDTVTSHPFWNTSILAFTHLFLPVLFIHGLLYSAFCLCLPSTILMCPPRSLPMPGCTGSLWISSTHMWTSSFITYMLTSGKPSTELQAHTFYLCTWMYLKHLRYRYLSKTKLTNFPSALNVSCL